MGPRERQLSAFLESISVVRQAYHGHSLVGNHCIKVIEHHEEMCTIIQGSDKQDKIVHAFQIYEQLHPLLYANRFLSDEEVEMVVNRCDEFGTYYPQYFTEENVFRKVHELVCTVPRFVQNHRTIGLLSEQSAESLHAAVNCEARALAGIRSKSKQFRLQFIRQEIVVIL